MNCSSLFVPREGYDSTLVYRQLSTRPSDVERVTPTYAGQHCPAEPQPLKPSVGQRQSCPLYLYQRASDRWHRTKSGPTRCSQAGVQQLRATADSHMTSKRPCPYRCTSAAHRAPAAHRQLSARTLRATAAEPCSLRCSSAARCAHAHALRATATEPCPPCCPSAAHRAHARTHRATAAEPCPPRCPKAANRAHARTVRATATEPCPPRCPQAAHFERRLRNAVLVPLLLRSSLPAAAA